MSRKFMHVSIAILCLALAYHLGSRNAGAQAPGDPVVCALSGAYGVVTASGEVYVCDTSPRGGTWAHWGNVFSGGPTPVERKSLGQLKTLYRSTPPGAGVPPEARR